MRTHTLTRAAGDIRSVCRAACVADAARWMASLAAHLPECATSGSLAPADKAWAGTGARFRTPTGALVSLPADYTAGAREMYCRNVYLRTGLIMPAANGWVVDLGANRGLFSVWAAVTGAAVVAVEAQQGFAPLIRHLAAYNGVADRVHVETAMAGGVTLSGAAVGVLASDSLWAGSSHGLPARPGGISMPELMLKYDIARVGLLKVDIEGGEFALFGAGEDLHWLSRVDQMVLEVHGQHGDVASMVGRLRDAGFGVDLRDDAGDRVTVRSERLAYAYCAR